MDVRIFLLNLYIIISNFVTRENSIINMVLLFYCFSFWQFLIGCQCYCWQLICQSVTDIFESNLPYFTHNLHTDPDNAFSHIRSLVIALLRYRFQFQLSLWNLSVGVDCVFQLQENQFPIEFEILLNKLILRLCCGSNMARFLTDEKLEGFDKYKVKLFFCEM